MKISLKILNKFIKLSGKTFTVLLMVSVLGSQLLYAPIAHAATYTFTQSSWTGGTTAATSTHTSNQSGWTELTSTLSTTAETTVTLPLTPYLFSDDGATSTTSSIPAYGGGFSNGASTALYSFTDDGATSTSPSMATYGGGFSNGVSAANVALVSFTDDGATSTTASLTANGGGFANGVNSGIIGFTDGGATSTFPTPTTFTAGGGFANGTASSVTVVGSGATSTVIRLSTASVSGIGGVVTAEGSKTIHTFTSTTSPGFFTPVNTGTVNILVVAGGGGGGSGNQNASTVAGAGGGAGGVASTTYSVTNGVPIPVKVGAGGYGFVGISGTIPRASSGVDSTFGSVTAIGGGGGCAYNSSPSGAGSGGSGGGGCTSVNAGGTGTSGQGYAGGSGTSLTIAGGGGGAGGVGATSASGGAGGVGTTTSVVSGTFGGGGGTGKTTASAGAGGAGGGGTGGIVFANGSPGSVNTGGGGGGGSGIGSGGHGGSGIVVVSYSTPTFNPAAGTFTSAVIDLGVASELALLSVASTTSAGVTSVSVSARAGDTSTPDGTWTAWVATSTAATTNLSSLGSHRYVQYRAALSTTNANISPTLNSVTVHYNGTLSNTLIGTGTGASVRMATTSATGGTITTSGGYTIHTFTSTTTADLFVPANTGVVNVFVVAGGGGGGGGQNNGMGGGGGGGGGVIASSTYLVTSGVPISVTVGGGSAGAAGSPWNTRGTQGSNSVFGSETAIGGGGGGTYNVSSSAGTTGGSGGGASATANGASGTLGQGTPGGTGYTTGLGGGGGGAMSEGVGGFSGTTGGAGGTGYPYGLTGLTYGSGGGGGAVSGGGGSASGGGGAGGQTNASGSNGTNGVGGGGGGGANSGLGGKGGSGVIIVSYPTPVYTSPSDTFTSTVIDLGDTSTFSSITVASTTSAGVTAVSVNVRAGDSSIVDGTWTDWTTTSTAGTTDISSLQSHRYVQYKANLSTTNATSSPTLDSVIINYTPSVSNNISGSGTDASVLLPLSDAVYVSSGTFTSAVIDTATTTTAWSTLSYSTTTQASTGVSIKVRSSNSSTMSGATAFSSCTAVTSGAALSTGNCVTDGHRYVQYEATLTTSNTSVTPSLNSVTINYSAGATNTISGSETSATVGLLSTNGTATTTSGTFTSAVIDLGVASPLTTLSHTKTTPANTTLTMDIRAGNTATPDGTWTSYTAGVASGGDISALGSKRYVQYRANLATTDTSATPTLDSVTIGYSQYPTNGNLTSSKYDTESALNLVTKLSWTATGTTTNETVKFQVRSSADGNTWSEWCGPATACDGTDYFTDASNGVAFDSDHPLRNGGNDQWVQYKVFMTSAGGVTPSLTSIVITYAVNAPPDFDATYGTNGVLPAQVSDSGSANWGKVTIGYSVRDTDTASGTVTPGYITPSFEYSTTSGTYWAAIPSEDLAAGDTSDKAVEESNHNTHTAVWNASSTLPSVYKTTMQVRVTASDNEAANSTATATSGIFTLDTTAPVAANGNVALNATTTSAFVTLTVTDNSQNQYRICNDSAFPSSDSQGNSCGWSAIATTTASTSVAWILPSSSGSEQTAYFQVRDVFGQTTSKTLTAPATPTNFIFADVSNPSASSYGEYLSWTAVSGASTYQVYYATTTGSTPSASAYYLLGATVNNYYTHTITDNLTAKYWYKATAVSSNSDISTLTSAQGDVPDSYGTALPDSTAPVVSAIATSSVLANSAVVTLTTDEIATSTVMYGTAQGACSSYESSQSTTAYATSQSISLSGLSAATTYFFCVRAGDTTYNTSTATSTTNTGVPLAFTTGNAVNIFNIATSSNSNSFTVTWDVSTSSDSYINYATSTAFWSPVTVGSATILASTTNHSVTVTGLSASTGYYFSIKSTDGSGNSTTDTNSGLYYGATTTAATTDPAPVLTSIATSSVLSTSAVITIGTNKIATTSIAYGVKSGSCSYDSSATSTAFATLQSTTLSGLSAATTYCFRAQASNTSGYVSTATSTNETGVPLEFTTATATVMPLITSVATSSVNTNAFTVTWNTSTSSDSYVYYSISQLFTTSTSTGSATLVPALSEGVYQHSVNVTGLTASTSYYFSVKSIDADGNSTTDTNSGNYYNVDTTSNAAPIVSAIATSSVLSTSAIVTFTTNELATSTILYGTESSESCTYNSSQSTSVYSTSQSVSLSGLTANTQYYFCIKSTDIDGVTSTATSTNEAGLQLAFTTASGPVISSVTASNLTDTTATISWMTALTSDSYVYYSTSPSLADLMSVGSTTLTISHEIVLTGLTQGIAYYYYVKSTDGSGNSETDTNSPVGYYTISDTRDSTAPIISNVTAPVKSTTSAAIVWQTDELSTSQVYYGGSSGNYTKNTSRDATKSIYHVMTLASTTLNAANGATDISTSNNALSSNSLYYFVVVSTDVSGNTATSSETTFSTDTVDVTAPTISSIAVPTDTLKSTTAIVTFTTDEVATSSVQYMASGGDTWTTVNSTAYGMSHRVSLTGLTQNTTYTFQVRAGDAVGNTSSYSDTSSFITSGGPTITSIVAGSITDSSATITWNTSTSSDSYVYYSTSSSLTDPSTTGNATMVELSNLTYPHSVILSNLSANVQYYFYVKSTDSNGDSTSATSSSPYNNFTTTVDTTGPIITNVSAPVTSSSAAVITWRTNELSTSQVEFGTIASTTSGLYSATTAQNPTGSIFHIVTLSSDTTNTTGGTNGLIKNTTYYYRVKSVDSAGNSSTSNENSFSTTEDGAVTVVTNSGGGGGGSSVSLDTTPPIISDTKIDKVTPFSATISFSTNEETMGTIAYGETVAYGDNVGDFAWKNSHTITVKGLRIGTEYHFSAKAVDKGGNTAISTDQVLKTDMLAQDLGNLKLLDTTSPEDIQARIDDLIESALPSLNPPFIETPSVVDVTENSATINWKTNVKSFGSVSYASDSEYNNSAYVSENVEPGPDKKVFHSVTLSNLRSNTKYHYAVRSYVFQQVPGQKGDFTFITQAAKVQAQILDRKKDSFRVIWTTEAPSSSIVEYRRTGSPSFNKITDGTLSTYHDVLLENLTPATTYEIKAYGLTRDGNLLEVKENLTVTTSVDITPPKITNLRVDSTLVPSRSDRIQTVVSWKTDEPATSVVYYEEGSGSPGASLSNKQEDIKTLLDNHVIILTTLKPGTIYRFQISSSDDAGNVSSLPISTIVTPRQNQSIVDVIFKNFGDTFSFIK